MLSVNVLSGAKPLGNPSGHGKFTAAGRPQAWPAPALLRACQCEGTARPAQGRAAACSQGQTAPKGGFWGWQVAV